MGVISIIFAKSFLFNIIKIYYKLFISTKYPKTRVLVYLFSKYFKV